MTFQEFMQENGYDLITTFWEDFSKEQVRSLNM